MVFNSVTWYGIVLSHHHAVTLDKFYHVSDLSICHYITLANNYHVSVLIELWFKYIVNQIYMTKKVILKHIEIKYKKKNNI